MVRLAVVLVLLAAGAAYAAPPLHHERFGRSVRGAPLRAIRVGDPAARRKLLVVGCVHGNECAGEAVTRRLGALTPPSGTAVWVVDDVNPDGHAAGTRQNADGVDLNRNFGFRWRPLRGIFNSGPRPFSEPESRAARGLIRRVRPAITIWFHQHMNLVDAPGGDIRIERRYARLVGLPVRRLPPYPGTATRWQNHTFPGTTAFVVELPAGRLTPRAANRYARAVIALATVPSRHGRTN